MKLTLDENAHSQFTPHPMQKQPEPKAVTEQPSPVEAPKAREYTSYLPVIALDVANLPSQGKAYPVGAIVKYKPYTYGEISKASNSKNLTFKDNVGFVLEGVETNFPKEDLTLFDVMYISLLRNISSVKGAAFKVPFFCPECGKRGEKEMAYTNLEFEDIKAPKLPAKIVIQDRELQFWPLTLKNFLDVEARNKEDDDVAMNAIKVRNLPFEEAYEIISNLYGEDQDDLVEIEKMLDHSIKPLDFPCPGKTDAGTCGNRIHIELSGGEALIMPFRKPRDSAKSRIQFG